MKKINTPQVLTPFGQISRIGTWGVITGWILLILGFWLYSSIGTTHIFPTPKQTIEGFSGLYSEGLIEHVVSSLALCFKAVLISILLSLTFAYASTIPLINPFSQLLSKFRYLPLTGISFYITMLVSDARTIQVWVLVVFMSTFLITGLLSMIKDIPEEEFDHARALGYNRWMVLYEVILKGRLDYVIETVRQNLAIVWMMLVTVESILAAAGGLGFLIKNSNKFMNHGRIVALQIVILLLGLSLDYILTYSRKIFFRYSKI